MSETWSVRIEEELKENLKGLIEKNGFKNPQELLKSMVLAFEMQNLKKVSPSFEKTLLTLDNHLQGIQVLYKQSFEDQRERQVSFEREEEMLKKSLIEEKEKVYRLEQENELLKAACGKLEIKMFHLKEENTLYEKEISLFREMFDELKEQLRRAQITIDKLEAEEKRLKGRLSVADAAIDKYRDQNALSNMNWNS